MLIFHNLRKFQMEKYLYQFSLKKSIFRCYGSPSMDLGQLSRQLLQPPVGSNTDVGETQTHYLSVAILNGSNQY